MVFENRFKAYCPSDLANEPYVNGNWKFKVMSDTPIPYSDPESMCPGPNTRLPIVLENVAFDKMITFINNPGKYSNSQLESEKSHYRGALLVGWG